MSLAPNGIRADEFQKKRSKVVEVRKSPLARAAAYLIDNQIEFPLAVITVLTTGFVLELPGFEKFLVLQYRDSKTGLYVKGKDDIYLVIFWITAFTLLRATVMKYVLVPIAGYAGVKKESKSQRFAEQGWSFMYYSIFWTLDMYVMYHSPHWLDTAQFWKGYPHTQMSALFKWYYLAQFAFWIQQIFVLSIEKKRKDFLEMLAHHFVTSSLMFFSYIYNFTRVGNAVLCVMDFSDILLPFAKMLKYLGFTWLCDVIFGIFMVSWVSTRHGLFGYILYSTSMEARLYIEDKWAPEEDFYFPNSILWSFIGLFSLLQIIILYWSVIIAKIAWSVIRGDNADDRRSDSEDEDENTNIHGKSNGRALVHQKKD